MKIEYHKCDRCGKLVEIHEGGYLHNISLDDTEYEICEDCFSSMFLSMTSYNKEVDEFLEKKLSESE